MLLASFRLMRLSLCLCAGLGVSLAFNRISPAKKQRMIRLWSRALLWSLGVRLSVCGAEPSAPCVVVANHVSWLDVVAMAAVHPAAFVAKSEIAAWPVIGGLLGRAGTVFIRRRKFRDILRVNDELRRRLAAGQSVALFPEATTTDGSKVLPFRPALLQPAVERGLPVHPAALRYSDAAANYIDDMSFGESLLAVARARGLEIHMALLAPVAAPGLTRKAAARQARAAVISMALLSPVRQQSAERLGSSGLQRA